MSEISRRVAAVNATRAKFEGQPFTWGKNDCAKIAVFHARQMGHRVAIGLSKAGSYDSALGAKRALKRAGFKNLSAALARAGLLQIPAAAALPGDVFVSQGTEGWEALSIFMGNMAILGFHEENMERGLQTMRLHSLVDVEAWRI